MGVAITWATIWFRCKYQRTEVQHHQQKDYVATHDMHHGGGLGGCGESEKKMGVSWRKKSKGVLFFGVGQFSF